MENYLTNRIDECIKDIVGDLKKTKYPTNISYILTKEDIEHIKKSNDIDLSSFKIQSQLNSKVWKTNELLNSKVRLRLLDIADDFVDFLDIDWVKPNDIILTGSMANYNWSKYSDFDVHILIDFKDVDEKTEFVQNYFNSKKKLWNEEHENLKIYNFPVEMYVQDVNEEHDSTGIYSLEKNKWITKPQKGNLNNKTFNKSFVKEKAFDFISKIEKLEEKSKKETDGYKIEQLGKKVKNLFDKIKGLRKDGLKKDGEMSSFNIIFKVLRRMGYIEKLVNLKIKLYDKQNSLK